MSPDFRKRIMFFSLNREALCLSWCLLSVDVIHQHVSVNHS